MITIKERQFQISSALRHIGYKSDNLVETRTFCTQDKTLFGFDFFIDLENTLESNFLEKSFSVDKEKMYLVWNISSGCLKVPGVITFQLRGVDSNGVKVWHSEKNYFLAGDCVDVYSDVTSEEANSFLQIEKNVLALKNEAQAFSEKAHQSSLDAQEHGKNAEALCDELREDYSGFKEELYTKEDIDEKLENKVDKQTLTAHTENTNNPHGVSAEQVGAYTKEEVEGRFVNWHEQLLHKIYHNEINTTRTLRTDIVYLYKAESLEGVVYDDVPFRTATIFNSQPFSVSLGLPTIVQTAIANDGQVYVRELSEKRWSDEYDFTIPWVCKTYTKEEIDNKIGSIDTALDELHAYATSLIGGEA